MKIINMLARRADDEFEPDIHAGEPIGIDEGFARACEESLAEPMKTPTERLREAVVNILTTLNERDEDHDTRINNLREQLKNAEQDKADNLAEIATVKRALDSLSEPETSKKRSRKPELIAAE